MSYTYKKVLWEKCLEHNPGIVDVYGDITRSAAITVTVRKQPHEDVIRDQHGNELLTKSYFYIDPKIEPHTLSIEKMDKLDGETVMSKYEMCDLHNNVKLIRFITV